MPTPARRQARAAGYTDGFNDSPSARLRQSPLDRFAYDQGHREGTVARGQIFPKAARLALANQPIGERPRPTRRDFELIAELASKPAIAVSLSRDDIRLLTDALGLRLDDEATILRARLSAVRNELERREEG